ncbi:hypothetical protein F9C07_8907 [Aspergillus flavus]|uniref:Uncharacterized protein n=1 Tax=Aspergillus flavus (strain ATCC 200026 / FGSC A1120 / IAM 13836 / NRRL 3357 / JCM 12722 / SRRC 167) TaxID=332952 RepID=A0A7U2MJ20_ASPFN|nr:hypothetical protein F9C07_8907 [Aspergillus flavus]
MVLVNWSVLGVNPAPRPREWSKLFHHAIRPSRTIKESNTHVASQDPQECGERSRNDEGERRGNENKEHHLRILP